MKTRHNKVTVVITLQMCLKTHCIKMKHSQIIYALLLFSFEEISCIFLSPVLIFIATFFFQSSLLWNNYFYFVFLPDISFRASFFPGTFMTDCHRRCSSYGHWFFKSEPIPQSTATFCRSEKSSFSKLP